MSMFDFEPSTETLRMYEFLSTVSPAILSLAAFSLMYCFMLEHGRLVKRAYVLWSMTILAFTMLGSLFCGILFDEYFSFNGIGLNLLRFAVSHG